MRIDELSRPSDEKEVAEILQRHGYSLLGSGIAAQVYGKPGANSVLKVFHAFDRGYLAFANLAMKHPNPHFPKFWGKLIRVTNEHRALRMEILKPMDDALGVNVADQLTNAIDQYLILAHDHTNDATKALMNREEFTEPREALFRQFPHLAEACDLLNEYVMGEFQNDIHSQNIMLRGMTPVIIDPVYGRR